MANFNGLRPPRTRPAGAGRLAVASFPPPLLLALFAAFAAFLLFQLGGSTGTAEQLRAPAFLVEALGAPQADAPLASKPARGVSVAIRDDGYHVAVKDGSVALTSEEAGQEEWRRFANGVSRPTAFGAETIVVEPKKTEQYLTVTSRQGEKTWTWKLATTLEPRLAKDGGVDFVIDGGWHEAHKHFHGPRLAQYRIPPVAILDAQGKDITPAGLRWSLAHRGSSWWLELALDDSSLPLPYVIDPAITLRGSVGSSNGGEATLVMTMPSGVVANDFLIAMVTVRGGTGTTITPPAGWTPLRRDDNGTSLGQAIYYKVAGPSEPLSYTWTQSPAVRASGGIIAYTGVDNADPFDVVGSATGNSALVTAPSITTSENNAMVVAFYGIANCNNGGDYWTPPLGMAERIDVNSTGAFNSRSNSGAADVVQAVAGPTGPKAATAASSGPWIAQLVALRLDVAPPAAPVQTISESTADSHASGSTFYYRPAGAGGSFTVTAATNDGTPTQSGINKVNLPGLAGGFTPTTGLDDTVSPYERTYSWTTGATESGAKTVTATDNAGNTNTGTFTITPDSTAPTTTDNTASIGSSWKNSNQTVTLTPSDGAGSGAATTYYTTDGTTPTTASPQGTSVALTSNGSYTVKYFSVDNVGNSESPVTAGTVINIDKTNPTSATLDPLPAAIHNGHVLTGAATDGGPSGIASISYYYCAGPPCTPATLIGSSSTGPSYSVTWNSQPADGDYQVLARASDNAGNTLDSAKQTVTVDNTAPNTTITASPSDPDNDADPSFSFTSSEAGSTFECKLDAGAFGSCTSPKSYTGLTAGSHTFEVKATDAAGNVDATPASHTWTIDLTDPNTTITASPSDPDNDADPSFSFTSSEAGSTFECKLDAGAFASCTSPKSYTGLSAGSHTFEVKATDAAGNVDATPASFTWTIDLTDPETTITASPPDPDNDTDPSFSFTSSEAGSTFECKLDGGAFTACASPKSYTGLTASSHTFEVVATDAAGNGDPTPASFTWTIDLTDPQTTITSSPPDPDNDADPSFSFSSSEAGSSFECKLDAGAFASCTSPKSYTGLSAGSHTFEVKATDAAGNVDPTPASHTWTIDLTDPQTTITASPPDPSNETDPSFSFTSSEAGSSFECKLDAGSFESCTSPKSFTGLSAGSHTFEVKATDPAGNVDPTPGSHTWTIDLTDPNTSITASPPDPDNDADPSFSFASSEAGSTFECELDAGAFASCTSPKSYTGLAGGSHTFEVVATDAAGNVDPSPASHTWTIDLTDPNTSITASPPDPDNDADPSFSFSSSEAGSTFECKLDGGAFAACTSPKSYTGLAAGSHTFEVKATDAAGNVDPTPASHTWTIDLTDPNTIITSSPNDPSNDADPSFSFTSSEAGSTFECKLDAGAFASCTSPKSYTGLAAGSHTFEVKATDAAGNTDATPASLTWTIDLTDPQTTIDLSPANPTNSTGASFGFSSSEAGSTFDCQLDGGGFATCTSPKSYAGLSAGSHTFVVKATDAAGNVDPTPASFTWTIDLTDPNTTITAAPPDPSNDEDPSFSFTSSEAGSTFECKLDVGAFAACTSPQSYTGLGGGSHTFEVKATDAAGNTDATPASRTWTIDLSAPSVNIDSAPSDPSPDTTPTFEFSASEISSTFECELDGSGFSSCSSPATFGPLGDGNHTFSVQATDPAGNPSSPATYTWLLNSGSPTVSITAPTAFVNAADADPFTITATTPDGDVMSVGFFRCDNTSVDCATGSWVLLADDPSAPYSAPWPVDPDGNRALRAVATDVGSNTGAHVVNVTIDRTLPVTTIDSGPTDPSTSANATFGFSAEAGASFACRLDGGSFAPCTSPHTYTGLGDGAHVFEVRATDAAGNVEAAPPTYGWTIDATAPETTITVNPPDPSGSGSADFEFTSSEAGSTFLCELDGGGFSSCSSPHGFTGLADGNHTFKVKAVDAAGNPDPSAATYAWLVDATDPDGGLVDPGSPLRGTVTLTATPSDEGAGVKEVEFQHSPANAGSWTAIAVDDTAPFTTPWDTTAAGDGPYDLRVIITDNVLNSTPSAEVEDRLVDNTDPSATMTDPGAYLRGTVALSSSTDDGSGSGIATVVYQRSPANAGTWTAVPQNWDTTSAADGLYDLRVVATDNAGNSAASAPVEDRTVDNTKPGVSSSTPADGSTVDSAASLSVVGSESLARIAGATIDGAAAPPPVVSGATVTYSQAFAVGPHTLAGELEDLAGNRTPILVHFTVLSAADAAGMADLPYTEKNSYASVSTSLAASSGGAEVTVPLGAWTGAAAGDWLVVRVDPRPMVGTLAGGFQAAGDILDVTAYWALAGTEVHDFTKALDIRVPNAAPNALPAVLEGSSWRILAPVTGTQLPSGQQDGFYRDGTDRHILTRHLSSFAVLNDVQKPSKPRNFRGANSSRRLVLRWDAATDNSGLIGSYAVYANGVKIKTLAASARSVDLGRFKTTDARRFQLRAYDAAGNAGSLTYKLAIVPAVKNLTLTYAKSRLVKRGLRAGTVRRAYSSTVAAGRVISAGKSGLVRTGTRVSLTVSLGRANRPSTSAGTGTSTGTTGTGGTSGPTSGFSPQPQPAPFSSTGGAPQPQPQPQPPASGSSAGEGEIITTLEPTSQSESSGLRNALGIALLGAAFLVALGALWRSRRRHYEETASAAAVEPVLFWDTRLLQAATSTVRRLTGRA